MKPVETLSDYIQQMLIADQQVDLDLPVSTEAPTIYNVYPEQHVDSDHKINPYGQH